MGGFAQVISWLLASVLAGWLAGSLANWAADVLPGWGTTTDGRGRAARDARHYLTGGWTAPGANDALPLPGVDVRRRRTFWLQAASVLLFLLAGWQLRGDPLLVVVAWAYNAFLLTVLVIDLETRRVLNIMVGPAAVVALLLSFLPGMPGPLVTLLGGAAGFGGFLVLFLVGRGRAMGFGDVKLAGLIGLMLGYPAVVPALVVGILLGGLAALALLITRKAGRKSYIAYAPYLALGALVVLLRLLGS